MKKQLKIKKKDGTIKWVVITDGVAHAWVRPEANNLKELLKQKERMMLGQTYK